MNENDEEELQKDYNVDINPLIRDYMIKETFNIFDEDGSGDIDKQEFSKLTDALGLEISAKKQTEIIRELDKEGSGTIGFQEFLELMSKFQLGDCQAHLENAFNDFDKNFDNKISVDDFLKVSEELDEVPLTKKDAKLLVALFKSYSKDSLNKNFFITKDEFINTLYNLNFIVLKDKKRKDDDTNKRSTIFSKQKSSAGLNFI